MFWGGLGGVWKVSGRCLGGVWDVLEVFGRCLGVFGCCLRCVLGCFGSFRSCLGARCGRVGSKSVDMGRLFKSGRDIACESSGLRGKGRTWITHL